MPAANPVGPPAFTNTADPDLNGLVGGLHAGRNWQFQSFAVGLEGDFSWSGETRNLDGSAVSTIVAGGTTVTIVNAELNTWKLLWFSTIRGRLGWANDGWLVYATGGAAVGRAMYDHTSTVTATVINAGGSATATVTNAFSESKTRWGYAVGGGIEKAFSPNWIGRLEYLYVDLGSYTFLQGSITPGLNRFDTSVRLHDNIVRAGISYLFNAGPVIARY
jgi:outer membrane immunogenic protein